MSTHLNILDSEKAEANNIQHRPKGVFVLLALLLVLTHFVFLMVHFAPAISTPDANAYFAQAKLIAKEGKTYIEPESPLQYIGPHWHHTNDNRYFCTVAPGFPTILAVIYKILGPKATLLVSPLMASLSLLGLFLLCRLWIGEGWGLLAAALMAVNPTANEHALFGDSHAATAFFLIWSLLFLAVWMKTHSSWWAFGTGLFLGIIPTIRYPEVLFCPAFGIFALFHLRRNRMFWRSLLAGVLGAAIPIAALCIRNHTAFGAFWKTGYALAIEQTAFGWNYFTSNSFQFLQMLMSEGCALAFGLGVTGIAILCARRCTWRQGTLFATLVIPITLVYMSYFWRPDPQSMRFLLPTFYIYTIAAVWLLRLLTNNHYPPALAGSVVLVLITIWWGLPQSLRSMQHLKNQNAVLARVTSVVEKHVEPGNILIANEGINQHFDFIGHWRLIDAFVLNHPRPRPPLILTGNPNIPVRKVLRNIEAQLTYTDLAGKELFNAFSRDVWRWAGKNRKVYWLADAEQINSLKSRLSQYDKLETIQKIELPGASSANVNIPISFRAPANPKEQLVMQNEPMRGPTLHFPGPHGRNRIFDLLLNGEPLLLVEWTREFP